MNLSAKIESHSKPFLLALGVVLTGIIGAIDYWTGYELSFSVFYVLPISLITWLTSRKVGILASLASAIVWFIADQATDHPYSHPFIPVWNTLIRFIFFVIITTLLSAFRQALHRESELARTDHLTGAINSRYFYELAQTEVNRIQGHGYPFTLAYFDLDNFKTVNDQFGHATGDQVLYALASAVRKQIRRTDIFVRLGGDEFALLLPQTNEDSARVAIPKIQAEIQAEMGRNNWPVTCSIGVLTCMIQPVSVEDLVRQTDEVMYQAKESGKNFIIYSTYKKDQSDGG